MSDAPAVEMPPEIQAEVDKIVETTKKGFDLKARLEKRGLRKATITLYLDEVKGAELGDARDEKIFDTFGMPISTVRIREGVVGELDALKQDHEAILALRAADTDARAEYKTEAAWKKHLEAPTLLEPAMEELEAKRDALIAELTESAIVVSMKAVPPIIQKDTVRRARVTMGITEKGIPEDRKDEYSVVQTAHLMTVMFQTIRDNATGEVNDGIAYEDAIALMDFLPPGQFHRLDRMMGQVQYTDAISRNIEGQEDFS